MSSATFRTTQYQKQKANVLVTRVSSITATKTRISYGCYPVNVNQTHLDVNQTHLVSRRPISAASSGCEY